jgi:hypothetical protein
MVAVNLRQEGGQLDRRLPIPDLPWHNLNRLRITMSTADKDPVEQAAGEVRRSIERPCSSASECATFRKTMLGVVSLRCSYLEESTN